MCVAAVTGPTVLQELSKASAPPVTVLPEPETVFTPKVDPTETYIFVYKGYAFQRDWRGDWQAYQLYMNIGKYHQAMLIDPNEWDDRWEALCDHMIKATKRYFRAHRETRSEYRQRNIKTK